MVSSLDEDHPGDNILDGSDRTYWVSTGLYPQELLVQLCHPAWVSSLLVSATHVRQLRIEGCCEDQPVNFQVLADGDLGDTRGTIQVKELPCQGQDRPVRYIRMMILSGWHDFCSVHRLQVQATKPDDADIHHAEKDRSLHHSRTREGSLVRRPSSAVRHLHVDIPQHKTIEHPDEPDAPRQVHPTPWRPGQDQNEPISPRAP